MPHYSKILLFGEYTIIQGGQALAMPLERFSCRWERGAKSKSNWDLRKFADYLQQLEGRNWLNGILDLPRLRADLKDGFFLESNIPVGYGLGSSGALCAAVYDRYALERIDRFDDGRYPELRHILGLMESHFHGASSGVDPLICYLNQAVLIKTGAEIERISVPDWPSGADGQFFLLDTGQPRQTGPLVERFLQKCEDENYANRIEKELIPLNEAAIAAFLQAQWSDLFAHLHLISDFQWQYFREMIPENMQDFWQEGLNSDHFKLKLCGAGGGGFLLGLTQNADNLQQPLGSNHSLIFLE